MAVPATLPPPPPLQLHGSREGGVAGAWVYVIICADSVGGGSGSTEGGDGVADVLLRVCSAQRQCGAGAAAAAALEDCDGDGDGDGDGGRWGGGRRRRREVIVVAAVGVVQYAQLQIR